MPSPKFPKDDFNFSKKGTPEEKGARACRHCRSGKHWDNECKHAHTNNFRRARTNLASGELDEFEAQEAYDELYQDLSQAEGNPEEDNAHVLQTISEIPERSPPVENDLDTPPDAHCNSIKPIINNFRTESGQGGSELSLNTETLSPDPETPLPSPKMPRVVSGSRNFKTKLLHKAGKTITHLGNSQLSNFAPQVLLKLRKHMSRPAGCAFLGTKATTTKVWLGEHGKNQQDLIADSGSDIMLISQGALNQMENPLKIQTGQKVNLIQVTGTSKISGYMNLPIIFETDSGPVQIDVEVYVIKGMTTPVILGNDFADQFSISIV